MATETRHIRGVGDVRLLMEEREGFALEFWTFNKTTQKTRIYVVHFDGPRWVEYISESLWKAYRNYQAKLDSVKKALLGG